MYIRMSCKATNLNQFKSKSDKTLFQITWLSEFGETFKSICTKLSRSAWEEYQLDYDDTFFQFSEDGSIFGPVNPPAIKSDDEIQFTDD